MKKTNNMKLDGIKEEKYTTQSYLKDQVLGWKVIPVFMTSLSMFSVLHAAFQFEISFNIKVLLESYHLLLKPIEHIFSPIILVISNILSIDIKIGEELRHAAFILSMYLMVDLRVGYLRRKSLMVPTVSTIISGLFVLLTFSSLSVICGSLGYPMLAAVSPAFGLGVYEMLKAPVSAHYQKVHTLGYKGTLYYYLIWFGISNIILAFISLGIYSISKVSDYKNSYGLVLLIFLFMVALRNIAMAVYKTCFHPAKEGQSWLHRFLISGSMQVAGNLLSAMVSTIFLSLINSTSIFLENF